MLTDNESNWLFAGIILLGLGIVSLFVFELVYGGEDTEAAPDRRQEMIDHNANRLSNLEYWMDERTGKCFATLWSNGMHLTEVSDCSGIETNKFRSKDTN